METIAGKSSARERDATRPRHNFRLVFARGNLFSNAVVHPYTVSTCPLSLSLSLSSCTYSPFHYVRFRHVNYPNHGARTTNVRREAYYSWKFRRRRGKLSAVTGRLLPRETTRARARGIDSQFLLCVLHEKKKIEERKGKEERI